MDSTVSDSLLRVKEDQPWMASLSTTTLSRSRIKDAAQFRPGSRLPLTRPLETREFRHKASLRLEIN